MKRDQVLSILGSPQKREVYGSKEYLIYATDCGNSNNERLNNTPILLEKGNVVGWGRNYYEDVKKSKIEADINVNQK